MTRLAEELFDLPPDWRERRFRRTAEVRYAVVAVLCRRFAFSAEEAAMFCGLSSAPKGDVFDRPTVRLRIEMLERELAA